MNEQSCLRFDTLRFLGRMNSHLTHDLKNVLATMSETAGLLEDLCRVDLHKLVRFMADLSQSMPFARKVALELDDSVPAEAQTEPYLALQMLYGCFAAAFSGLEPDAKLRLAAGKDKGRFVIRLTGLAATPAAEAPAFPDPSTQAVAQALGAEVSLNRAAGSLEARLPVG